LITLGLLLLSLGLDWAGYLLREQTSQTFLVYPQIIFRICANLLFMALALTTGWSFLRNPGSRPVSIFMLIAGLLFLLLPLSPVIPIGFIYSIAVIISGFGFSSYSSLAGGLLVVLAVIDIFRGNRS
jgi:hypothetical protein